MLKIFRSLIFDALFYICTPLICLAFAPFLLLPFPYRFIGLKAWAYSILFLAKRVLGLKFNIIGKEHIPTGPFIVACKHQSAWETIALNTIIPHSTFILKHTLLYIPIINLYMLALKSIAVKRGGRSASISDMIQQAKKVTYNHKLNIIIFPEGRRTAVGEKQKYRQGVAALYEALNVPVLPIALNSGLFWGRRSILKKSGEITVQILPAFQPGLHPPDFLTALEDRIETATDQLCKQNLSLLHVDKEMDKKYV